MIPLSRLLLVPLLLAVAAAPAHAVIVVIPVTKDTQAKVGLDFTLFAVREADVVWVRFECPRKDKLRELAGINLEIKDAKGHEIVLAPLEITEEKGVIKTHFRLKPEHAERCNIVLIAEQSKPPEPAFGRYYSIQLKEYVGRAW
jgi:hypothetical protein